MKNTKREVLERLVALNRAELEFLRAACNRANESLSSGLGSAPDCQVFVYRVRSKLDRALSPPRKSRGGG